MCDYAWNAVAVRMETSVGHFMDHAWMLGFAEPPFEPWGFVSEPYMADADAAIFAEKASDTMADWGVRVVSLPRERSSWNPGSCAVIVALLERHTRLDAFVRAAVEWEFSVP